MSNAGYKVHKEVNLGNRKVDNMRYLGQELTLLDNGHYRVAINLEGGARAEMQGNLDACLAWIEEVLS